MEHRPSTANQPPGKRNRYVMGAAAAALVVGLGGYALANREPEKPPVPEKPPLDCVYFRMDDRLTTYLRAFVEPKPGSAFDEAINPVSLVKSIDVKFGDAGPDGPSPIVHPELYEPFNHQFVNADDIKTRVDITVHAKPDSGFKDGHCSDVVSFNFNPGVILP